MSILAILFSFFGNEKKETPIKNDEIVMRYFLGNSALHKQKSDKGIYLYDEISKEDAEKNQYERAYFVGFYRNDILIGYQKIFRGEVLMEVSKEELLVE